MTERIWRCKIGGDSDFLPAGSDAPMRDAVARAFREITGRDPQFIFSGWGAELNEGERAVVENRAPRPEKKSPTTPASELEPVYVAGLGTPVIGHRKKETFPDEGKQ